MGCKDLVVRFLAGWLAIVAAVSAEKLPIRSFTTADGLPHNTVMRIVRDSRGFLWFCTLRGLACFDGYTFKNYGTAQGLRGVVTGLLETRAGEYWVATLSGLYRFHPVPYGRDQNAPTRSGSVSAVQRMFELYPLTADGSVPGVNALYEDRRNTIWAATNVGLYRLATRAGRWTSHLVELAVPGKAPKTVRAYELLEDRDGALWISLPQAGVKRVWPDGRIDSYNMLGLTAPSIRRSFEGTVAFMLEDRDGRIWLGSDHGLSVLARRAGSRQLDWIRTYTSKDGLRDNSVRALFESSDGGLWVGTSTGLSRFCAASDCGKDGFRSYTTASLGSFGAETLAQDSDGNLWIGNETGALRLARDGFSTYDQADGLGSSRVYSVFENLGGRLYVVTPGANGADLNELEQNRFNKVSPPLAGSTTDLVEPTRACGLQDQAGDWWVTTDQGLCRYTGVKRAAELAHRLPENVYTSRNGLPPAAIISLYGDSRGDVWVGSLFVSAQAGALSRWQRSTRTFRRYGLTDGLTASTAPLSFCEDRLGSLWVGFQS